MDYNFRGIKVHTEGDSHSERIDIEIKGLPQGQCIKMDELQVFMDRRHGEGDYLAAICGTTRREPDVPVFDAGVEAGRICDAVIKAHIDNKDVRKKDYEQLRTVLRPGHADLGAYLKYGAEGLRSGGGEFSGRMTAALCLAGGIAKQILESRGIDIDAYILEIGGMPCFFLEEEDEEEFVENIEAIKAAGDSLGGVVGCRISAYPAGIGGPGMDGLESDLAAAMLAIPSAKGIEFGSGFDGARATGSENNDAYFYRDGDIVSRTNNQGGISGGISTGMDITMNVAFKPVPSIGMKQRSVDVESKEEIEMNISGRHDVCIVPRVLPVVEAVAALVMLDRLEADNG